MRDEDLPAEFKARMAAARALTDYEDRVEPRAVRAWYDAERDLVLFELKNRCVFGFPAMQVADWGLAGTTPEQLAQVEPDFGGSVLHWEPLEDGIVIGGLLLRLLNVKAWYAKRLDGYDEAGASPHSDGSDAEFEAAEALFELESRFEPRAVKAWFDADRGLVMFELKNGCVFGFPPAAEADSGLAGATPTQLGEVEPFALGEALRWEELDADISVPGLLLHQLNVKAWCWKWFGGEAPAGHPDHGRQQPSATTPDALQPVEHVGD